jgi:hypothetical protein
MTVRHWPVPTLAALLVASATPALAQNDNARLVRELDVGDPQLESVLFKAVDYVFDDKKGPTIGFGGIFIKRKLEPALTADVRTHLNGRGLARIDKPGDCDALPSRPGATPPMGTDKNGRPIAPATVGTPRAQSSAICNRGFEYTYSFHMVRIAADSAYVETRVEGQARSSTQCAVLTVAPEGGWRAIELRRSKIGKCGE